MKNKSLVVIGMLAPILYMAMIVIGSLLRPNDYDNIQQLVHQLASPGAPNRLLIMILLCVFYLFVILFAFGTYSGLKIEGRRGIQTGSVLLILAGTLGVITTIFFPLELDAPGRWFRLVMHFLFIGLIDVSIFLAVLSMGISFGGHPQLGGSKIFSIFISFVILGTAIAMFVCVFLRMPLSGLFERICMGSFLVWLLSVSITFLFLKPKATAA